MAGGVAGKAHPLYVTAIAKCTEAIKALQYLQQFGAPAVHGKHAETNTAVSDAITALQAVQ